MVAGVRHAALAIAVLAMVVLAGCAARDASTGQDPGPSDEEGEERSAIPLAGDAAELVASGSGWIPVPAGNEGDVALVEGVVFDALDGSLLADARVRVRCQDTYLIGHAGGNGEDGDVDGSGRASDDEADGSVGATGTAEADAVVRGDTVDRVSPDAVSGEEDAADDAIGSVDGPLPPALTAFTDADGRFALPSSQHLGALAACPAWSYTAEAASGDLRLVVPLVAPVPVEGTAHVVYLALDATRQV